MHSSAGLLASEIDGLAKGYPPTDTRLKEQPKKTELVGWQEDIFGEAPMSVTLFHSFSAVGVGLSTHGSFYNESAIVSAPDSENRRSM